MVDTKQKQIKRIDFFMPYGFERAILIAKLSQNKNGASILILNSAA
jgi:hypothetical protein